MEHFIGISLQRSLIPCKDAKLCQIKNVIISIAMSDSFLVWPQWWSFADTSQQGVDFSKKITKTKIISWFDFHRCSQWPSKIGHHLENKVIQKLMLSKNVKNKKWAPTLWEQTYQKQETNWYLVNFIKYLVNVPNITKYLVNVHQIS